MIELHCRSDCEADKAEPSAVSHLQENKIAECNIAVGLNFGSRCLQA